MQNQRGWMKQAGWELALVAGVCLSAASAADLPVYELEDFLGKSWVSNKVSYALAEADIEALKSGYALVDSQGNETLYQVEAASKELCFLATIRPFEKSRYRFTKGDRALASDLYVKESDEILEVGNARFAVRIRRQLKDGEGPLASWRLPSGSWAGSSSLSLASKPKEYHVRILRQGPVVASVECKIVFENGGTYQQVYDVQAGEPLAVLRETFDAPNETGAVRLVFSEGFKPEQIIYRSGALEGGMGALRADEISQSGDSTPFLLEPWLHWNFKRNRGTGFNLVNNESDDLLFFMTSMPAHWVDPTIPAERRARSLVELRQHDGQLFLDLEIRQGQRELLLGALGKSLALAGLMEDTAVASTEAATVATETGRPRGAIKLKPFNGALLSQQYQMEHSDFPLDRIKDYVLEWPEVEKKHPCLILSPAQLAEYRNTCKPSAAEIEKAVRLKATLGSLTEQKIPLYLATGDARLEKAIVDAVEPAVQALVTRLTSGAVVGVGTAPHNYISGTSGAINELDVIYPALSPESRRRIRAQLAFLGYLVNSPAYWDRSRDFGAMFINMHTTVHKTQAVIAAMLSDHPRAGEWMGNAMQFLQHELLEKWVDKDGRWIGTHVEAPHYAMGSFDDLLATLVIAKNAGMNDLLDSPAMKQMGEYFARISTPPDSRILNWRHFPPIGNTYKFEPSGVFSILASVYKESDPSYAARMQWMQNQQGNPMAPVVGGYLAGFAGYRGIFQALTVKPETPDYRSEWLNESGVILRSRYATAQENLLYLIAGKGATPTRHYDRDQGAITLWGRGEIISDDFGYNGCAPEEEQSMMSVHEGGAKAADGIMDIARFNVGSNLDYVVGTKMNWTRQAVLVKNTATNLGPDYFVIHDALSKPAKATWRMWLTGKPVTENGAERLTTGRLDGAEKGPLVVGEGGERPAAAGEQAAPTLLLGQSRAVLNGVSKNKTDLIFARIPPDSRLETAIKTQSPYGLNAAGKYGRCSTSQIGLILKSDAFDSLLTLVFSRDAASEPPKVEAIADNRGFKIEYPGGTDYVFVSKAAMEWSGEGIAFAGTVGLVQVSEGTVVLSLSDKGTLDYRGTRLTSDGENVSKVEKLPVR